MADTRLKHRLLRLANRAQRSNFQRIVDVFAEIEGAMDAGATRAQIVEALNAEGIDVSAKVFTNYMLRIREMRARGVELDAEEEPDEDGSAAAPPRSLTSGRPTK